MLPFNVKMCFYCSEISSMPSVPSGNCVSCLNSLPPEAGVTGFFFFNCFHGEEKLPSPNGKAEEGCPKQEEYRLRKLSA